MSSEKDVVTAVIKLQEERDELAAMLAYSLGSTRELKKFLSIWDVEKRTKKGEGYPSKNQT